MSKSKLKSLFLAFVFLFVFAASLSPRPSQAYVATIDLSQLAVIRDTMQIVNQQLQQLQELTQIQDDILNAIGDATGIDPNSILFQGLMELACGKFQLPRINFNLPIPQLPYLDLPDSLCDWFGYGAGYQSDLWARVMNDVQNTEMFVRASGFVDMQGRAFTDALAQSGGNAICGMYTMRWNLFHSGQPMPAPGQPGGCPATPIPNPPGYQPGDPVPIPIDIQLDIRHERKKAKQVSIVFAQSIGMNSMATAGNAGAQIKNMIDQSKNSENINQQLATQNAILIKLYEQNAQIVGLLGAMLDMQGKHLMEGEDVDLRVSASTAP